MRLGNDEWTDMVSSLHTAARRCVSAGDYDRAITLLGWVLEELGLAFEQERWGDTAEDPEPSWASEAQALAPQIIEHWRSRSGSFGAREQWQQKVDQLPSWILPEQ